MSEDKYSYYVHEYKQEEKHWIVETEGDVLAVVKAFFKGDKTKLVIDKR